MIPPPPSRPLRALAGFERLADFGPARLTFYLWLCVWAVWGIFRDVDNGGLTQDWQFFQFFSEVSRKTVLEYHQFPFWNPYWCGGITQIGNPQTTFLAPTFPLTLIFGTAFGPRLEILVVLVLACEGSWRLGRHLGMGTSAALLLSMAWPLFGRSLGWYTDGQVGLHGVTLASWVLYGWLRGIERTRYLVLAGAFLAWIVAFRGIQPGPQLALAFGLWAVLLAGQRWLKTRSWKQALWPAASLALVGAFAFGFMAVRMLPVLETVLAHPRVVADTGHNTLTAAWVEIFWMPRGTRGYPAAGYAYIGRVTYLLFLGTFLFAAPRSRAKIPLLIGTVFLFIILGDHGEFSIYHQLHRLPFYRSLRNPALYSFTGAFLLVLCAATTLDELDRWLRRRSGRLAWLALALPVAAIGTGTDLSDQMHAAMKKGVFTTGPTPRVEQEFKQTRGNHFVAPTWPRVDRGSLDCYDETPWRGSRRLRPDLPEEEYLGEPAAGTVRRVRWSPNKLWLDVELSRPATLYVNQNWARGWSSSVGQVRSQDGLLAVDLPAGMHRVVLAMRPPLALAGVLVTLLAVAAAAWLVRRDRRRERAEAGAKSGGPA